MTTAKIDPAALMRIRNLQLRAKRVVEGFYNGLHRSPYHGFSVEFSQYRPYTEGDDPKGIDWKLYARTDRYHIKQFEDETSRRCYLAVDQSRSMAYGSLAYDKAEYARTVAATLAYFLTQQRDSVGLITFADDVTDFIPSRHRPGHFRRILVSLEKSSQATSTSVVKPLEKIASTVRRRGLIILISDFLAPVDALRRHLSHLRGRGHEVMVLRILDPAEISFSIQESTVVQDLESGREIFVDPGSVKDSYQQKFKEHAEQIVAACNALGVRQSIMMTNTPIENALFELISTSVHSGTGRGAR